MYVRKHDAEQWNLKVQQAIRLETDSDWDTGCMTWQGGVSRYWKYPLIRVEGYVINVRQWNSRTEHRRVGHASFFAPTCGNALCVRNAHMRLVEIVPVETVRAMERQMNAERNAA